MRLNYLIIGIILLTSISLISAKSPDVDIMGIGSYNINYPSGIYNSSIEFFNWSGSSTGVTIHSCSYELNGVLYPMSSCIPGDTYFSLPLADDSYLLFLYLNYSFNSNPSVFNFVPVSDTSFIVDTLPPQISINYPSEPAYNSSVSEINYNIVEANPSACWFSNGTSTISNISCIGGDNVFYFNSSENENNWTVYINDSMNRLNSSSVSFLVDTIYPEIYFLNSTDSGNLSQTSIHAEVYTNDTNLENVVIYLYGNVTNNNLIGIPSGVNSQAANSHLDEITSSTTTILNAPNLSDGTYYLNATACDLAGNCNSTETRTIIIDSNAPVVSLINPKTDTPLNSTDVTFEFNVSDYSAIASCSLIFKGLINQTNETITKDSTKQFTLSGLSSGEHSWQVSCTENFEPHNKIGSSITQNFTILSELNFSAGTNYTYLPSVKNISSVNFFVGNSFGMINWTNPLDLSRGLDWSKYISISDNNINVDSINAPELDQPAIITLYNINLTTPQVLRNGAPCGSYCPILNYNGSTLTLTFSVTGFSVYTTREYQAQVYGSSSGGGGSGCRTNWTCTEWSVCADGQQTRTCTVVNTWCKYTFQKPEEIQPCITYTPLTLATQNAQLEQKEVIQPEVTETKIEEKSIIGITGAFIGANAIPISGAVIFISAVFAAFVLMRKGQINENRKIKEQIARILYIKKSTKGKFI